MTIFAFSFKIHAGNENILRVAVTIPYNVFTDTVLCAMGKAHHSNTCASNFFSLQQLVYLSLSRYFCTFFLFSRTSSVQ
jgi:hypothetical protein